LIGHLTDRLLAMFDVEAPSRSSARRSASNE
jgi:hypothetical protein